MIMPVLPFHHSVLSCLHEFWQELVARRTETVEGEGLVWYLSIINAWMLMTAYVMVVVVVVAVPGVVGKDVVHLGPYALPGLTFTRAMAQDWTAKNGMEGQ